MLVDARTIAAGDRLDADVCVVGAGPAGIAVARVLERAVPRVLVLAGGDEPPAGEVAGEPYPPLATTRAGGIGGTAALWDAELAPSSFGARYVPLASIDFEDRAPWSRGGWPFDRETLDSYYARAHELCDAGPYDYAAPEGSLPFADPDVTAGVARFGAAATFTAVQRRWLEESDTVRVLAGAAATRVVAEEGRAVAVEAATAADRRFSVAARTFVLAAGGIENARLLLVSGIGDEGVVGSCFMDHPTIHSRLELSDPPADLAFFDTRTAAGRTTVGRAELAPETMRREQLLNGTFFAVPARDREARAGAAARTLLRSARERRVPPQPLRLAADVAAGIDALAYRAHRRLVERRPSLSASLRAWPRSRLLNTLGVGPISGWSGRSARPSAFDLYHVIEQAPDPARRVSLSAERDALGNPLARLHWFVGSSELESAERSRAILARALERAGAGRLHPLGEAPHPSAHHHLGTTRMHADPRLGVADADGRVHGTSNLFVTGGSVFPTSGFANPTLTIVALALRLGAYLREDRSS